MTSTVQDFREMSVEHLDRRVQELAQELVQLREEVRFGKEKNHAKIGLLKREVARVRTILKEKNSSL
jgi:large subunit ribosomal protein L29